MPYALTTIFTVLLLFNLLYPMSNVEMKRMEARSIKQTINSASRVLVNSIEVDESSYETFSLGYYLDNEDKVEVDKERLVTEFNAIVERNVGSETELKKMQMRMPVLFLTYGDRFYTAEMKLSGAHPGVDWNSTNVTYVWNPPQYYSVVADDGKLWYLTLRDDTTYYYRMQPDGKEQAVLGQLSDVRVKGKPMTTTERDTLVIQKVNQVVQQKTAGKDGNDNGFQIQVRPADYLDKDTDGMTLEEKQEYYQSIFHLSNFNVLNGITFFIVYSSSDDYTLWQDSVRFKDYNAAGFTLEKRY